MADVGTLLMKVDADTKSFEKGISRSQKAFKGMTKAIKVGAVAASAAIIGIGAKSIKLAQEQERAEARLESIAKKVTKATDDQIKSLKNLAAAQQKVSTFGDEVLISGQSQLLSFGLQADQVEDLTGSLADLLAANNGINASQEDAINAANLLGKAFSGQAGALSRVGILLDDTQAEILKNGTAAEKTAALVAIMDQNYGGLAETLSQTTEGQIKQLKNTLGDMGETIGNKLLPQINKFVGFIMDSLPSVQETFTKVFSKIKAVVDIAREFIEENFMPVIVMLVDWVKSNMPIFQEVFNQVFSRVLDVVTTLFNFYKDNLFPIFESFFEWVKQNMPQIKEFIVSAFESALKIFDSLWKFIKDYILPVIQSLFDLVADLLPKVWGFFREALKPIISLAGELWDFFEKYLLPVIKKLFDVVADVIPKLVPIFEVAFDVIKGVIDVITGVIEGLIGIIASMIEFTKDAIDALKEFFSFDGKSVTVTQNTVEGKTKASTGSSPRGKGGPVKGGKANGGPVLGGSTYLVGEKGPEMFTPTSSGVITPNGGASVTININGTQDPNLIMNKVVDILNRQGITRR